MSVEPNKPIVLVFLAAGVQGSAVVRAALARGFSVRALVRDRSRIPGIPLPDVEWIEADLDNVDAMRAASAGIRHAVLQVPTGPADAMVKHARNAAVALCNAELHSMVLKLASASRPVPCTEPSFVGNSRVEGVLRDAGLAFATVRPTMYLDNLLKPSALREIIQDGVFAPPIPASQRIAWTSADDCARAAITLLERGVTGDFRIAGMQSMDGAELAASIQAGLGLPVRYRAQPIEAFERDVDSVMGVGMGARIGSKFRYFASYPEEADAILAQPFKPYPELQGFEPLLVQRWVRMNRQSFLQNPSGTIDAATHDRCSP